MTKTSLSEPRKLREFFPASWDVQACLHYNQPIALYELECLISLDPSEYDWLANPLPIKSSIAPAEF